MVAFVFRRDERWRSNKRWSGSLSRRNHWLRESVGIVVACNCFTACVVDGET